MRRPQAPEIFIGLAGRSWSRAIRTVTASKSTRKVEQQVSRPQLPMPPFTRASSRGESWVSCTLQSRVVARSRTSCRKSIRVPAVKYTVAVARPDSWPTSDQSTALTFIGSLCSRMSRCAATWISARRLRLASSRRTSSSPARPGQTGRPPTSSATHSGPHTTSAISGDVLVG